MVTEKEMHYFHSLTFSSQTRVFSSLLCLSSFHPLMTVRLSGFASRVSPWSREGSSYQADDGVNIKQRSYFYLYFRVKDYHVEKKGRHEN